MMLRKALLCALVLIICSSSSFGQEKEPLGTAVYIELAGKGFVSVNGDFAIGRKDRLTLGLTMLDHEFTKEDHEEEYPTLTLPTPSVMYFHLFGRERHYFEAGLGFSISPVLWREFSDDDSALSLHGCLGYRKHVTDQFFFRAGITPFYRINWVFLPLAGVSFGYSW